MWNRYAIKAHFRTWKGRIPYQESIERIRTQVGYLYVELALGCTSPAAVERELHIRKGYWWPYEGPTNRWRRYSRGEVFEPRLSALEAAESVVPGTIGTFYSGLWVGMALAWGTLEEVERFLRALRPDLLMEVVGRGSKTGAPRWRPMTNDRLKRISAKNDWDSLGALLGLARKEFIDIRESNRRREWDSYNRIVWFAFEMTLRLLTFQPLRSQAEEILGVLNERFFQDHGPFAVTRPVPQIENANLYLSYHDELIALGERVGIVRRNDQSRLAFLMACDEVGKKEIYEVLVGPASRLDVDHEALYKDKATKKLLAKLRAKGRKTF